MTQQGLLYLFNVITCSVRAMIAEKSKNNAAQEEKSKGAKSSEQ